MECAIIPAGRATSVLEPTRRAAVEVGMWIVLLACQPEADPLPVVAPPASLEEAPPPADPVCDQVLSPFRDADRGSLAWLSRRFGSGFGDYRSSYIKGHKHAGLDLRTRYGEDVYAICAGVVEDIHLASPHQTVVVRHRMPDGATRWSSYKHLEDLGVKVGQAVDADTRIGRVFTEAEQSTAGWKLNHLHFEVRTSFDDRGTASWMSMTREELERYATDPKAFFEAHLAP